MTDFDAVLVGGGLANALIALALLEKRPACRVALVEQGSAVGGNHTWCFHAGDIPERAGFVDALVETRWAGYDVSFPGHERTLEEPYAAVTSTRLAHVVAERFAQSASAELLLGARAEEVGPAQVRLADGRRLDATLVVDARGPEHFVSPSSLAYQKFVGLELELSSPAPLSRPMLMDARVPQRDGFRFVYTLPFDPHRVLVEDTYFSDDAQLDVDRLRAGVLEYAAHSGLSVARVLREERGVLPLPVHFEAPAITAPLRAGYGGGWFHPTTGYSFPVAARLAAFLAEMPLEQWLGAGLSCFAREHARQARFACLLNRLLFSACAPDDRIFVLERFYRLPPATVRRFYALSTTATDRARIVCGRPPRGVSIRAALTRGVFA